MPETEIAVETRNWQEALPVLRRLSTELDAGIQALARQDLDEFEKHLTLQAEICDVLLRAGIITGTSESTPAAGNVVSIGAKPSLIPEVYETVKALDHKRRVYSALIERAKNFVGIMQAVHHSCVSYSQDSRGQLQQSTWSSEV